MDIELLKSFVEYRDGCLFWKAKAGKKTKVGTEVGYVRKNDGYRSFMLGNKNYLTHRVIYALHHNEVPLMVDHIDCDRTNNNIENLRSCSNGQNMCNASVRSDNKSGVKNVWWEARRCKWKVSVAYDGKQIHVGYFKRLDDAKVAAVSAREQHHGLFARHE
jgi:hypothetical protein